MIRTTIAALICTGLAMAGPAAAQEVEVEAIEEKNLVSGKQTLDAAKAYIFITGTGRAQGQFIKTPDAEEISEYEAEWLEEFEKAKEKYPRKLERWKERRLANKNPGEKPLEPTEETFAIEPIETRMLVGYGPQFVFSKGKNADGSKFFHYVMEVEPGNYTYYGPIFRMPNGQSFGTCYCMGSVRFEAKAGEVTSLGDFLTLNWADNATMKQSNVMWVPPKKRPPVAPAIWDVPESLSALPSVEADLRAAGKINNFFNIMVGRMPPVDGVLGYERDTPIDLKGLEGEVIVEASSVEETGPGASEAGEVDSEIAAEPAGVPQE